MILTDDEITALLNEVYADTDSTLDPAFAAAQLRAIAELDDWQTGDGNPQAAT